MAESKAGGGTPEVVVQKGTPSATLAETRGAYDVDEHLIPPQEVAQKYGVSVDFSNVQNSHGLTSQQVQELRAKWGLNQLTPPKELPEILKLLKQFLNPLMLLLVVAGALTLMAYGIQDPKDRNNIYLGCALLAVVTFTCIMSYMQERSANNVMASLGKMMPSKCTVYRDGKEMKVDANELVPGDLVRLYIGDRVPADIRIIETADLKVECSSLTGESDLIPATVDKKHDLPQEARNIVFMSSLCMNGEGRGIVVRTGDNTFIGKIASLASQTATQRSTLQEEVHRLVVFVAIVAFSTAIIFFVIGLARKMDPLTAFVNGFILVIVANVPEGLPATVTTCLTLTALKLKDKNVLIKRTDIVENLGCASIIASDKTGTLTQNRMTVENVWCNLELHKAAAFIPPPSGARKPDALARESRQGLGRVTLNRASRRILEKTSRAVQGTSSGHAAVHGTITEGVPEEAEGSVVAPTLMTPAAEEAVSAKMSLGRDSVLKGTPKDFTYREDGTLEFKALGRPSRAQGGGDSLARVSQLHPANQMKMNDFKDFESITWDRATALTRLIIVATIVNKAKFAAAEGTEGGKAGDLEMASQPAVSRASRALPGAERKILGDATDSGLLRYVDALCPVGMVRQAFRPVFNIPFNSANKWALTVTDPPSTRKEHVVMMKGAPEIVLTKCSHYFQGGVERVIDDNFRSTMMEGYERCGFMGERVLGFAYKVIPARDPETYKTDEGAPPTTNLVFMGLISLVDPPRDGVLEAVKRCRGAGIRVSMVTGDHPLTAEAIARKVGIITLQTPREVAAELGVEEKDVAISDPRVGAVVVSGQRLRELQTVEEWDEILDHEEIVFARTSPQQKLQIVENLQRRGEVVAVTGDGVNDSPALKKAQIGVAMGMGGSDVARDAADIVLLDDQFPSIVNAIEEGRVIFDNLKKTIAYTLSHAIPEVWPIFLNLALSWPLGLGGLLILSIDLLTEQGPAISLAYERAENNVMDRPPRDIETDRLISGSVLRYAYLIVGVKEAFWCMMAFFTIFWWYGISIPQLMFSVDNGFFANPPEQGNDLVASDGTVYTPDEQLSIYWEAQSAWYVTLVMCQFWHIWTCKTRTVSIFKHGLFNNMVTILGAFISIGTILIIVYIPGLHGIFFTEMLNGIGWVPQIGFLIFIVIYTEYSKYLTRKNPDGWWSRNMQW